MDMQYCITVQCITKEKLTELIDCLNCLGIHDSTAVVMGMKIVVTYLVFFSLIGYTS
jgi:hypothetical protein